jgi:hypothetical protein
MLFFFAFFRAASAAVVSGRQTGSLRMLVRRTLEATRLLRETRERRWMYEDTASQVKTPHKSKKEATHGSSSSR